MLTLKCRVDNADTMTVEDAMSTDGALEFRVTEGEKRFAGVVIDVDQVAELNRQLTAWLKVHKSAPTEQKFSGKI